MQKMMIFKITIAFCTAEYLINSETMPHSLPFKKKKRVLLRTEDKGPHNEKMRMKTEEKEISVKNQ